MILADKIIENRKKNGWSQEELADKLGVSRQSVSKWESAQAVPDMKKILQMSEIFGVSTDYLLKDEIEIPALVDEGLPVDPGETEDAAVKVSLNEASSFLSFNEKAAAFVSTGVMLCIMSPILLILLSGLAEYKKISIPENIAEAIGTIVLLVIIAAAVGMFLMIGFGGRRYEYLENSRIDTEYGVSGMVRDRRDAYDHTHSRDMIIGIMLCIVAAIPMLVLGIFDLENGFDHIEVIAVAVMLAVIAVGVRMIVHTSIIWGGMDKLLEEGDYTRLNKRAGKFDGIYWAIVTAIYLGWSFMTMKWEITWLVWPVAGVLFAAYHEIMKSLVKSRN